MQTRTTRRGFILAGAHGAYADRLALKDLFGGVPRRASDKRNACIAHAYLEHGYTMKQIAAFLGLHYSSVSVIIHKAERET